MCENTTLERKSFSIISHWTLGISLKGCLAPIPVFKHLRTVGDNQSYYTDSDIETAGNRACSLFLCDKELKFKRDNDPMFVGELFDIDQNYVARSKTPNGMTRLINLIKSEEVARKIMAI